MKKKIIFTLFIAVLATCLFALTSLASTVYKDENGTELLRCEMADSWQINSYEILNGGFAKTDSEGNALTWYLVSTETVGENTVKTVKSVKTSDVYVNGNYTNGVSKNSVVSANWDEGLTSICAFGSYSGASTEILFVYIPSTVTALPERFMQNGSALVCEIPENSQLTTMGIVSFYNAKNIRKIYFPASLETIEFKSGHEFAVGSSRLEEVEFAKDCQVEIIPHGTFKDCSSLKSVTFPNSVTTVNSRVFQGCYSLEYVNFGANLRSFVKTDGDNSLFFGASAIKTVVLPYTFVAENIAENLTYTFQPGWGASSQITYYYSGTEEEFKLLQEKFSKTGNNGDIAGATLENGRLVLVDHCETFFGGHAWKGENNVIADNYFESIGIGDSCINCEKTDVKITIAPIFVWKGYSASTYGDGYSVVQGFTVNTSSIEAYKAYAPDFDFGILATVNKEVDEEGNAIAIAPKLDDENVLTGNFDKDKHEYLDIKVTGIPNGNEDALIVFCVYVTVNGKMYYLDNNTTGEGIIGVSYNEILALDNGDKMTK